FIQKENKTVVKKNKLFILSQNCDEDTIEYIVKAFNKYLDRSIEIVSALTLGVTWRLFATLPLPSITLGVSGSLVEHIKDYIPKFSNTLNKLTDKSIELYPKPYFKIISTGRLQLKGASYVPLGAMDRAKVYLAKTTTTL
ncbi:MAG: hypothetical protein MHPSP_002866, partial [Paramarteilia canceri]